MEQANNRTIANFVQISMVYKKQRQRIRRHKTKIKTAPSRTFWVKSQP